MRNLFYCIALFFFLIMALPAFAKPIASVGLVSFTAVDETSHTTLSWQTASELDSVGFNIYYAPDGTAFTLLNAQIIPTAGSPTTGATYTFEHPNQKHEPDSSYQLTEVDLNGTEKTIATTSVDSAASSQPIPIATLPTNNTNPTPNAPIPHNTPLPPPTEQPNIQSTAVRQSNNLSIQVNPAQEIALITVASERTIEDSHSGSQPIILLQTTPDDGYPPPEVSTQLPEGYEAPEEPVIPTFTPEGTAYVPPPTRVPNNNNTESSPADLNVSIIGDNQPEIVEEAAQIEVASLDAGQGRIYLWSSFIIALLIFGTAIYAATLIFTRKSQ